MSSQSKIFLVLLVIHQVLGKINYCRHVRNCGYIQNIVCSRKHVCDPTENCKQFELKRSTKVYILLTLNEYRNDVALGRIKDFPNASDMVTQYWDEDLEYVTKCAQNTCTKQEEACANTVKHSHTITLQNVFRLKHAVGEMDFFHQSIKSWTTQGGFGASEINQFTNTSSLSHAAILWCNSPAVGCALSQDSNFYYGACTFAIAPQFGEHVYHAGIPCSECPKGLECNSEYHGLCGEILLPRAGGGASSSYGGFSLFVVILEILVVLFMCR